jgi:hypothetical protein
MKSIWRWKTWKWPLYALFALFVITVGMGSDTLSVAIMLTVMIGIASIAFILFLFQCCFWMYHLVRHSNPFYESTDPYVYKVVHEKKQKAWCHLCKAFSGCRVRRNKINGLIVHVIR